MAPFVAPRVGGKVIARDGFKTYTVTTPKIALERVLTIDDISKLGIGENIYTSKTPEERADELFAQDLTELEEYIANRKEWMARQIILGGNIDVKDEETGVEFNVDFNFTNKDTLIGNAKWTDENSDPITDLLTYRKTVIKKCGKAPTMTLLGERAYNAFINNKKVKELLNIRNINVGELQPTIKDEALTYIGKIAEVGEIYTYDEWFVDDDGVEQAMLPVDTVVMLPSEIGSFEYGAVTQLEDGEYVTYDSMIVPKVITDNDNDIKKLRLTSRPLPRPKDVDSWFVAKVVD